LARDRRHHEQQGCQGGWPRYVAHIAHPFHGCSSLKPATHAAISMDTAVRFKFASRPGAKLLALLEYHPAWASRWVRQNAITRTGDFV
jgi:hypothetical protein